MTDPAIRILRPLWRHLGVEIERWQPGATIAAASSAALRETLDTHGVVLVRDFPRGPIHQLRMTAALGRVVGIRQGGLGSRVPPELRIESDDHINPYNALWHSDTSWAARPARYTLLYARNVRGACATTQFADTSRAYAALPQGRRAEIADWHAFHHVAQSRSVRFGTRQVPSRSSTLAGSRITVRQRLRAWRREWSYGRQFATTALAAFPPPGARHPVIGVDPSTRRHYVCLGEHAWKLDGMSVSESLSEIDRLSEEITADHVAHPWRPGDLLIFDNRRLLHRRQPDAGAGATTPVTRELRRTLAWAAD
jgi:alpha-ketoglutarate-dependent 2,4-dichlorophenoxyacetate dioxygenase